MCSDRSPELCWTHQSLTRLVACHTIRTCDRPVAKGWWNDDRWRLGGKLLPAFTHKAGSVVYVFLLCLEFVPATSRAAVTCSMHCATPAQNKWELNVPHSSHRWLTLGGECTLFSRNLHFAGSRLWVNAAPNRQSQWAAQACRDPALDRSATTALNHHTVPNDLKQ